MNALFSAISAAFLVAAWNTANGEEKEWHWREALLAAEGIEDSPEALREFVETRKLPDARLAGALQRLAADDFEEREKAQRELIRGGDQAYRWLIGQEPSPDPEVEARVRQILLILGTGPEKAREDALDHAVRTLLAEGMERQKETGGRFYDWFGEDDRELDDRYHTCWFENKNQRSGRVEEGRLILSGEGGREGDQSLVLKSQDWPGRETFGDQFQVSARLGGATKGVSAWHVGISIGNVRALYHPGYPGGAFRFSSVGELESLSGGNVDLGFTPEGPVLEQMVMEVKRIPGGKVVLTATIRKGGKDPREFREKIVVAEDVIGPLNRIALDRSGRNGGEAYFQDFSVVLSPTE